MFRRKKKKKCGASRAMHYATDLARVSMWTFFSLQRACACVCVGVFGPCPGREASVSKKRPSVEATADFPPCFFCTTLTQTSARAATISRSASHWQPQFINVKVLLLLYIAEWILLEEGPKPKVGEHWSTFITSDIDTDIWDLVSAKTVAIPICHVSCRKHCHHCFCASHHQRKMFFNWFCTLIVKSWTKLG